MKFHAFEVKDAQIRYRYWIHESFVGIKNSDDDQLVRVLQGECDWPVLNTHNTIWSWSIISHGKIDSFYSAAYNYEFIRHFEMTTVMAAGLSTSKHQESPVC